MNEFAQHVLFDLIRTYADVDIIVSKTRHYENPP